jgi:hypothetical protein
VDHRDLTSLETPDQAVELLASLALALVRADIPVNEPLQFALVPVAGGKLTDSTLLDVAGDLPGGIV